METPSQYAHIKGWGIDADPTNDPTFPIKDRNDAEHDGYSWERPTQQAINMEIPHSIERPNISAVFGTSAPLSGISGMIRRAAFRKSENEYGHWLPLMLADRVNMIEGLFSDLSHGHVPNLFAEKGLGADWKYDRKRLVTKAAIGAGVALLAFACLRNKTNKREM